MDARVKPGQDKREVLLVLALSRKGRGRSNKRRNFLLSSVELGARARHHVLPLRGVLGDRIGKVLRRAAGRLVADLAEPLDEARGPDRAINRRVEFLEDRRRQTG